MPSREVMIHMQLEPACELHNKNSRKQGFFFLCFLQSEAGFCWWVTSKYERKPTEKQCTSENSISYRWEQVATGILALETMFLTNSHNHLGSKFSVFYDFSACVLFWWPQGKVRGVRLMLTRLQILCLAIAGWFSPLPTHPYSDKNPTDVFQVRKVFWGQK